MAQAALREAKLAKLKAKAAFPDTNGASPDTKGASPDTTATSRDTTGIARAHDALRGRLLLLWHVASFGPRQSLKARELPSAWNRSPVCNSRRRFVQFEAGANTGAALESPGETLDSTRATRSRGRTIVRASSPSVHVDPRYVLPGQGSRQRKQFKMP